MRNRQNPPLRAWPWGAGLLIICSGLFVLVLMAFSAIAEAPPQGLSLPCTVVHVVDGDTVDVEVRMTFRVRLLDCWAPETHLQSAIRDDAARVAERDRGLAAKADLEQMALDKRGTVWVPLGGATSLTDVMTLERVLGHVWIDGRKQSLAERQRRRGNAQREKPPLPGS